MQILTIPGLFTLLYINDLVPNSETCESRITPREPAALRRVRALVHR
jgi:hypothetical protein